VNDVNNVHLVCRNLHQTANLHVNPKLSFNQDSIKDLECLIKSSRIFEELQFVKGYGDYLMLPAKFELIEEYLSFTGPHIKNLIIEDIRVDPQIFPSFLNLLPNLKSLELDRVKVASHQSVKLDLKSTKISRLKIRECTGLEKLPDSLEKCAIKEIELRFSQKNKNVSWEFLEHQSDLKLFRLEHKNLPNGILKMISRLENLETLDLDIRTRDRSDWSNHKLQTLKKLIVTSQTILQHLRTAVFTDLEEMEFSSDNDIPLHSEQIPYKRVVKNIFGDFFMFFG
jgi:hypothetical protein